MRPAGKPRLRTCTGFCAKRCSRPSEGGRSALAFLASGRIDPLTQLRMTVPLVHDFTYLAIWIHNSAFYITAQNVSGNIMQGRHSNEVGLRASGAHKFFIKDIVM